MSVDRSRPATTVGFVNINIAPLSPFSSVGEMHSSDKSVLKCYKIQFDIQMSSPFKVEFKGIPRVSR